MKRNSKWLLMMTVFVISCGLLSCNSTTKGGKGEGQEPIVNLVGPTFNEDSAYAFCAAQCAFGPRTMNSEAHERCASWIAGQFEKYNCKLQIQKADLKGYDGTILKASNIIASYRPEATTRVLLCAHWDSRPWADNDPDSANHKKPVMAANDGASGVAVMLEVARLLCALDSKADSTQQEADSLRQEPLNPQLGVDFVCFDAEDWGIPQWADVEDPGDTWALGAQYWAANKPEGYEARYGILLDMVGGEGAQFYREGMSKQLAGAIVDKVWSAAATAGYGSFFPNSDGGYVTDDHVPVNNIAGIPTIDIIPFYRDCQASSFGPTWHTVYDDMSHIDKNTLKAVGQTIIQVLFSEPM